MACAQQCGGCWRGLAVHLALKLLEQHAEVQQQGLLHMSHCKHAQKAPHALRMLQHQR